MIKNKYISSVVIVGIIFLLLTFVFNLVNVNAIEKKEVYNPDNVYVDIKGAVKNPGVYEVNKDSRIIDVIKKAGDLKKDADTSVINLSKKVKDEMYIIIYTKEEINTYKEKMIPSTKIIKEVEEKIICPDNDNDACISKSSSSLNNISEVININTASKEELMKLKGIGEGKAKQIIEYRKDNTFNTIEDIKNVPGIGDSLYDKIKDNIEV